MAHDIKTYPEPVLSRRAREVQEITPEIRELAREMAEIMYQNEGIGLAAPQIGIGLRLITVDVSGPGSRSSLMTLINPEILDKEGEVESDEGCLSVSGFRGKVTRAAAVTVKALDLEGNEVTLEADGLLAICLQHEIDHLNGTVILDHASRLKRSLYEKKVSKWQKQSSDSD
mgnify:CR=1 FL=1